MDEQRLAAYLNLIKQLLECPNGEEGDILNAHREWVDADLLQEVMEVVAANMTEKGDTNAADFPQNLAAELANAIGNTVTNEEYLSFLGEVLQATSDSDGNPQVVYPILQQNLDKLTLKFAEALQTWARSTFTEITLEQAHSIATIAIVGNLIQQFPLGRRAWNLEIGIACYDSVLKVCTREQFPQQWAEIQNNLGIAYNYRIQGEKAQNIELAIACYNSALIVRTPEQFPQQWATTQNNLGNAYIDRIQGEKAQNIEDAIACYREALIVYTPTAFPLECLKSSRSLGKIAFTAGFWEIAIAAYEQAMTAVEYSRSWITSDDRRQQIVAESIGVYENAIQACVNSGKLEKAIEYCDRTRSKQLVDLMHSNDLYANGEIPPEVAQYLHKFEAKQQEIDGEVEQLRNPSEGNKGLAASQSRSRAGVAAYTDKIAELEAEKQQVWENIRRLDAVLAGQLQVVPMEFAAMQQLIENPYTAILCFYTTRNDTHVFVIYKDKPPQVHTCHGEGVETFQNWISKSWLSSYLRDNKSWQQGMAEFLSQLSQRLKVNDLIGNYLDGIEELIVIPHLFLHQIPLAALPVDPPQPPLAKGGAKRGTRFFPSEGGISSISPP